MNSPTVLPKADEHTPDVPGILKRLVRTIAYTFYLPHHIAIFNVLLRHIVVDEDSLSLLVKIDKKQLRSMIVPLRMDKLVKHKIMKEKLEETGQYLSFTYYYINYHLFLNVIKYKLECMKRKIVHQEDSNRLRPNYTCSNCTKGFTDLDMSRLINMKTGELTCYMCHQPVHENEESKQQVMSRTLLAKFNQQFNYLYKLVDKCYTVEFDDKLVEPTVTRSHVDRAILSRNSLDVDVLGMFQVDRNSNAKTRRLLANTSYQQQFTIKFDDESNEQDNKEGFSSLLDGDSKNRTKEFPEWLKHSQQNANPTVDDDSISGRFRNVGMDSALYNNDSSFAPTNAASNSNDDVDQEIMDDIDELLRMEETNNSLDVSANEPSDSNSANALKSPNNDLFGIEDFVDKTDDDFNVSSAGTNDNLIDFEKDLMEEMNSSHAVFGGEDVPLGDFTSDVPDEKRKNR